MAVADLDGSTFNVKVDLYTIEGVDHFKRGAVKRSPHNPNTTSSSKNRESSLGFWKLFSAAYPNVMKHTFVQCVHRR